ncbi:MAG: DnaJ domain-containing protein [Brevinematales bacterium]|nr:DnaJ domain-containing protein [Brevinematales bacterium]
MTNAMKVLGLTADATPTEVKKAYRALAKENHPDREADPARKRSCEEAMARINTAYKEITAWLKTHKNFPKPPGKEPPAEDDYSLYKQGVAFCDKHTGSISLKFKDIVYDMDKLLEKKRDIGRARECFARVLSDYPDSDWAYDSEERLNKIDSAFANLDNSIEFVRTHQLSRTPRGTPEWKERE